MDMMTKYWGTEVKRVRFWMSTKTGGVEEHLGWLGEDNMETCTSHIVGDDGVNYLFIRWNLIEVI